MAVIISLTKRVEVIPEDFFGVDLIAGVFFMTLSDKIGLDIFHFWFSKMGIVFTKFS